MDYTAQSAVEEILTAMTKLSMDEFSALIEAKLNEAFEAGYVQAENELSAAISE